MPYLQVYFNGVLSDEVGLGPEVITIGRATDNAVKLDNAGVSMHHARIVRQDDAYFVEDLDSRNGVFVNGSKVTRAPVGAGDEITIFKHSLRLAADASHDFRARSLSRDTHIVEQSETVEVDVSNLGELVKQRKQRTETYLHLMEDTSGRSRYPLTRVNFTIGKSDNCDMRISGWFAPRLAAQIKRQADGHYVFPATRGRVRLNGAPIRRPARLIDGDSLKVRGMLMRFYERPTGS